MPPRFNPLQTPINVRLRLFFAAVVILMFLGSVLTFLQFRHISSYVTRVTRAERRASELLRLNSSLVRLMSHLHRLAEDEQAIRFETEAHRLLDEFRQRGSRNEKMLAEIAREGERHALLVAGIRSILTSLPARVSSLIILARNGDWLALHARLLNQTDQTDDVVEALTYQMDQDLEKARERLAEDLEAAQTRATNILVLAGMLSLTVATALGASVARSITRPLSKLAEGARALAAGNFEHRIPIQGNDELAHLAHVFNNSAAELSKLFEDVRTERAAAQAAESALQERAEELSRANADLEQFAYSASHDLKEPLRTVALYSQMLQRRYAGQLDAPAEEYIAYIDRGARQMELLITDLLTYTQTAQARANVDSPADVQAVLDRLLTTLRPQILSQQCSISSGPLPKVNTHEIHVQQVLQNLIGNAMKYRGDEDPEIRIWAEPQGDLWRFSVSDNGIGIEPQYAVQIFGIFKRLHGHKYPGTGIGLAICQRIVERYGGRIWVESELGRGAIFRFTLPAA